MILLGPFLQNGFKKYPKSITFIDKTHTALHHVEKPYKTNGKWRLLGPFSENGPKMTKKHYLEKVFATRFQNVGKPYKTNRKHGFSKCKNALRKTL